MEAQVARHTFAVEVKPAGTSDYYYERVAAGYHSRGEALALAQDLQGLDVEARLVEALVIHHTLTPEDSSGSYIQEVLPL